MAGLFKPRGGPGRTVERNGPAPERGTIMLDYIAYVAAQRKVGGLATSALPGAPVDPDPPAPLMPTRRRLRRRTAQVLVRTAERLEPGAIAAHRA
jgi:hypothetical protein